MKLVIKDKRLWIEVENDQDIAYFRDTLGIGYDETGNNFNTLCDCIFYDWGAGERITKGMCLEIARKGALQEQYNNIEELRVEKNISK